MRENVVLRCAKMSCCDVRECRVAMRENVVLRCARMSCCDVRKCRVAMVCYPESPLPDGWLRCCATLSVSSYSLYDGWIVHVLSQCVLQCRAAMENKLLKMRPRTSAK
jgi:hypothetical protein